MSLSAEMVYTRCLYRNEWVYLPALELGECVLEHVQVGRLAATRWAHEHEAVTYHDHLVQLDHLCASMDGQIVQVVVRTCSHLGGNKHWRRVRDLKIGSSACSHLGDEEGVWLQPLALDDELHDGEERAVVQLGTLLAGEQVRHDTCRRQEARLRVSPSTKVEERVGIIIPAGAEW